MPPSSKPVFEYPEPDLFEAYVDIAVKARCVGFSIGPDGVQVQFTPSVEPLTTTAIGFDANKSGDDEDEEMAGSGTTPPLPRNQRNPKLWANRDGMPPGFRRAPIVTPTLPGPASE